MPLVPQAIIRPNAFEFKINNFACNLTLSAEQSLVNLISVGADLYHGHLRPEMFANHASKSLKEKIGGILNAVEHGPTSDYIKYIDFQIKMLYEAQNSSWRMPAFVTAHNGRLTWHTGSTRLLATWMCRAGTQDLPVVLTDFDRSGPDAWLAAGVTRISDDTDLCQALKVPYQPYDQRGKDFSATNCDVYLQWHDYPGPCLHYANMRGSKSLDWKNHDRVIYADNMMQRLQDLGSLVPIKVYCEHSDQVTDSSLLFQVQHQPLANFKESLSTFAYHRAGHIKQGEIEIYLRDGARVDLAQLLFWLDDSTVYIDRRDRFVMITGGSGYTTKDIDVSVE